MDVCPVHHDGVVFPLHVNVHKVVVFLVEMFSDDPVLLREPKAQFTGVDNILAVFPQLLAVLAEVGRVELLEKIVACVVRQHRVCLLVVLFQTVCVITIHRLLWIASWVLWFLWIFSHPAIHAIIKRDEKGDALK